MVRISKHQLFTLIMLFEIGSTTLFALGIGAKQNAWLVILIAMVIGFLLLWVYTELQKGFPGKNLAEIIIELLGKVLGIPLCLFIVGHFILCSIYNFTEFGEIVGIAILPRTPRFVILTIFMLTAIYIIFLGLDVFARTSEIAIVLVLLFLISIYILITMTGIVNFKELTPIFSEGITADVAYEILHVMTFPFGEMVVFLMYWCYVDSQEAIRKTSFIAVGISGVLLSISLIFIVSVLGVKYAASASIPLLEVIKLINISDIIANLDSIGIGIIFIGGFYKMTIFLYGAASVLSTLFKSADKKRIIVFLGLFDLIFGSIYIRSFTFHRWIGTYIVTKYQMPPYEFIIPILLLIIYKIKRFKDNKQI